MPKENKVSDQAILSMLDQGTSQAEIGRKFGITRQAIYQRVKKYGHAIARNAVVEHSAEIVEKELDMGAQLLKAAREADKLLDKLKLKEDKESRELTIRALGEIRQQVTAWHNIRKDLFTMQQMTEVLNEILEVIGKVDENIKSEILRQLRKKGLLRGVF